jgi:hypothetical protein
MRVQVSALRDARARDKAAYQARLTGALDNLAAASSRTKQYAAAAEAAARSHAAAMDVAGAQGARLVVISQALEMQVQCVKRTKQEMREYKEVAEVCACFIKQLLCSACMNGVL